MTTYQSPLKIGITGQAGFIGTHLFNTLGLYPERFERIPFEDVYFAKEDLLREFVRSCDVIIHLAALNRHNDPKEIYNTNLRLVKQLIKACESTNSKPHILFSSSTQEERDNSYGKSKKEGRELFEKWAVKNNACFTGLVIPNVYGPFGNPYYNSFIATFCYQLTHGETPTIQLDNQVKLIYINELIKEIINLIEWKQSNQTEGVPVENIYLKETFEGKVSEVLSILEKYKKQYLQNGILPDLTNKFNKNLFNTFACYIDHKNFFPFLYKKNTDDRGSFVELIKLDSGGQISFSTTKIGITRGNHFHTRKAERFTVIKGKALIELRRIGTKEVLSFELDGDYPSFVDMPIWFTHNIRNIGNDELYTIFWINEFYDKEDTDTFFEVVKGV